MRNKTRVYHSLSSNLVRILHPDGSVEVLDLDLDIREGKWERAMCSYPGDYPRALDSLQDYVSYTGAALIEEF